MQEGRRVSQAAGMTDLPAVLVQTREWLAQVKGCLAGSLPDRGFSLPLEQERQALEVAREWLRSGIFPKDPESQRALFPRLCFAERFLSHLESCETLPPLGVESAEELRSVLMLEIWETTGRQMWESAKYAHPWAG